MTVATVDAVIERHHLGTLAHALSEYLVRQRWFGGRERRIEDVTIQDIAELNERDPVFLFVVARVAYTEGEPDLYNIPIGMQPLGHPMADVDPRHRITTIEADSVAYIVYDALADNECSFVLWQLMENNAAVRTATEAIQAEGRELADLETGPGSIRLIPGEQSNTSLARGSDEFLKWVRRIDDGPSVELEMIDALRVGGFQHMALALGGIDYVRFEQPPTRIAFLQRFLNNASEGWALALTSLRDLYATAEEVDNHPSSAERRDTVAHQGGAFTPEAARLGEVTAEMHCALASDVQRGDLRAVAIDAAMLDSWATTMTAELDRLLASENPVLDALRDRREHLVGVFEALRKVEKPGLSTRIHGDFHLGQVLRTDSGWIILDFEGEPARPSSERRLRWSPLRDVAGMLRSFDYAAAAALAERTSPTDPQWQDLVAHGDVWAQANREAFWNAYADRMADDASTLPDRNDALIVRRAFEVQKAVYEVVYELGHRPEWVGIPLSFLTRVGA